MWQLVSLPGALTPLHTGNNGTIALIAQLAGRIDQLALARVLRAAIADPAAADKAAVLARYLERLEQCVVQEAGLAA